MTVRLTISVPDVDTQLAAGFDRIRVFRGPAADGPFTEVTAENPTAATLIGSLAGPFHVHTKNVSLRLNEGPIQTAQIAIPTPGSANEVAASLLGQIEGLVAGDDGSGHLQLSSPGVGTDETIELLGDLDALTALGFAVGATDQGEAQRVPLITGVTSYTFEDHGGTTAYYYQIDFLNQGTGAASNSSVPAQGTAVDTVPKQQADARGPRGLTLVRKTSHVFREAFLADDGSAIVPVDASRYPSFQVVDINGQIVSAGLATLDGTAGNYRVEFFVAADALISNDDRRWRIEWLLIDQNNRQVEKVTEFDVRDVDVTSTQVRDLKLMALGDRPFRVFIRELSRPFALRLDIENAGNATRLIENIVFPATGDPSEKLLTETVDGETFIYSFDIPASTLQPSQTYQALWSITSSIASAQEFAFQIIEVPLPTTLQYFPALRMVIDKYQKRREILQAYQDTDINEYLTRGLEIVNAWHPLTSWTFSTLPGQITPFWLLGAQVWALNAQHLLETDLSFDFCLAKDELIRTDRGLVKLRDIAGVNAVALAADRLVKPQEAIFIMAMLATVQGRHRATAIADSMASMYTGQTLGLMFARLGLSYARSTDHAGGWFWDVDQFRPRLERLGLGDQPEFLASQYRTRTGGVDREVLGVWDLGERETFRTTTTLGYEVVSTAQHRFLTLDGMLRPRWRTVDDLRVGDVVAIDATAEDDRHWDVEFEDVQDLNTTQATKEIYRHPTKLTPGLARVLGYLVSEGSCSQYNNVRFGVQDETLLDQFTADFEEAFGAPPEDLGYGVQDPAQFAYDPERHNTDVRYLQGRGVALRRFLASIGLGYEKSRDKEIPWCVLQAPLSLAAEFLKTYFDGDGCFTPSQIFFCSFSPRLRQQVQALLLRFGVVSRNADKVVTVRQPSLDRYVERVGFLHKGGDVEPCDVSIREALPEPIGRTLRNITQLFGLRRGWRDGRRYTMGWQRRDLKYTAWRHLESWWGRHRETAEQLDPEVAARIAWLLDNRFSWQEVTAIEPAGRRAVMDPSLAGGPGTLDHAFTAGGFVTHNSGQTVTLNYDHTSGLEAGIQRALDFMNERLTPAKMALHRRAMGVGSFAGKPMRYNALHNYTFKISSFGSADLLTLLSNIGILTLPFIAFLPQFAF